MTAPTGLLHGKHRPQSHPLVRRAQLRAHDYSASVDELARLVARLPERLPWSEQVRLAIILRELRRRTR